MKPGTKPKPTADKLLAGNPGHRKLNDLEPQYKIGMPECPEFLDDVARAEWYRLGPLLVARGLLTEADQSIFMAYCECRSRYVAACEAFAEHGMTETTAKGDVKKSPYVLIAETAVKQMQSLATEFGLSPSSRARVKADKEPETENPLKALLASRGNLN